MIAVGHPVLHRNSPISDPTRPTSTCDLIVGFGEGSSGGRLSHEGLIQSATGKNPKIQANGSSRLIAAVPISELVAPNRPFKQSLQGQKFTANFVNQNTCRRPSPSLNQEVSVGVVPRRRFSEECTDRSKPNRHLENFGCKNWQPRSRSHQHCQELPSSNSWIGCNGAGFTEVARFVGGQ